MGFNLNEITGCLLIFAVHYVGSLLDGTQFDSSHDHGTPFKFKLGEGMPLRIER